MLGTTKQSNTESKDSGKGSSVSTQRKPDLLSEKSVYIEGVRVLQRQERISYFFTLAISLVLIILLFIILRVV